MALFARHPEDEPIPEYAIAWDSLHSLTGDWLCHLYADRPDLRDLFDTLQSLMVPLYRGGVV